MSVPTDPSGQTPMPERTVAVDFAAFLPEGVEPAGTDDDPAGVTVDEEPSLAPLSPWRPDLEALDAVEADLDAVDESLRALDAGTYGTCRACAEPIPDELLADSPTRTTCATHP